MFYFHLVNCPKYVQEVQYDNDNNSDVYDSKSDQHTYARKPLKCQRNV